MFPPFKPSGKRVTMREIAVAAGVHFTTVGLALRGSSQLPEATRTRICAVANKLGYKPDPMLSALNAYRRAKAAPTYQATIVWINNWPDRHALLKNKTFQEYYEGAKARAEEMGYLLEELWVREKGLQPARLAKVFRTRNIAALLLAPQPGPRVFPEIDFTNLAVVSLGFSLQPSIFHVVTNHHFHSMNCVMQHVVELGYKRIGLFMEAAWDDKVESAWIGGLALARRKDRTLEDIPPLLETRSTTGKDVKAWVDAFKPDVVLSHSSAKMTLERLNYNVPRDIGFVSLSLHDGESRLSGIIQNNRHIGRTAVDFVVSMLHSGERGVPEVPARVLLESFWNPGTTLRQQPV